MTLPSVWEDGTWPGLPAASGGLETEVCVIGLGAAGLSAVAEALRLGADVVGIDAAEVGGGASGRNGGFLLAGTAAFHHDAATAIGRDRAAAIHRLTADTILQMARETPSAVRLTGSLRLALSDDELADCHAQLAAMRADGLPAEPYEGPEGSGLLFPADGAFDPLRRCRLLAEAAINAGARLFERSAAIEIAGDRVTMAAGVIRCRHAIIAVDGGLERLVPDVGARVRTARAQMLATAPLASQRFPRPVYARWGYDYWQQLPDGRLALGGFRDAGGDDEWTGAPEPTDIVQGRLERFLREALGVRAPITHRWAGCIAFTEDKLPVIQRTQDGAIAVGAYSGTGNVLAKLCGRAAVELALSGSPGPLARLLAPRPDSGAER
ncbi:MAG TPA: FAD-dependent oxidoreductase [Egibacteraceae bacterium]|nr:FAD-dependent oxidoreductase [Egibacteraceae bacterium]